MNTEEETVEFAGKVMLDSKDNGGNEKYRANVKTCETSVPLKFVKETFGIEFWVWFAESAECVVNF